MFSFLFLNTVKKAPALLLLSGLLVIPTIVHAKEVIIIPKGTGIVWQGKPFSSKLLTLTNSGSSRVLFSPLHEFMAVTGSLGTSTTISCQFFYGNDKTGAWTKYQGYNAYVLSDGLYLTLIGNFLGGYTDAKSGQKVSFNGAFSDNNFITSNAPKNSPKLEFMQDKANCISLRESDELIHENSSYHVQLSGYWVILADGKQKSSSVKVVSALFLGDGSGGSNVSPAHDNNIFPRDVEFKISTLECNINTPPTINFGDVLHSNQAGKELASKITTIETYCSQGDEVIDSNINLTFKAISGNYENDTSKLSLKEGGGYITGQLEGAQQSFDGSCGLTGRGIPFDNATQIKLGHIAKDQPSASFINPVLWRLCAGGDGKLPYGKVTASAEVTVTLN